MYSNIQDVILMQLIRTAAHLQLKSRLEQRTPTDHMEVQVSLATTGEIVYSSTYSEVKNLSVETTTAHLP